VSCYLMVRVMKESPQHKQRNANGKQVETTERREDHGRQSSILRKLDRIKPEQSREPERGGQA
jgi:hypothetical protein